MRKALAALLLLSLGCACASTNPKALSHPCPAYWVSTEAMGPPFRSRYEFRARAGNVTQGFSAVVELTGAGLALVGFDRLGAQAFALRQVGTEIEIVLAPRRGFFVHPITVLGAIHRARFLGKAETDPDDNTPLRACGIEIQLRELLRAAARTP